MTDANTNQGTQNWVYVIGSAEHHRVKIGTAADVPARRSQLQTGAPFRLDILMTLRGDATLERRLHHHLAVFRVVGEWFDFGKRDALAEVCGAVAAISRGDEPPGADTVGDDTEIRSFDHGELSRLPQYAAASDALDHLAHALPDATTRRRFLDAVRQMAAVLPYSDGCNECRRLVKAAPFKVELSDGGMVGHYRCERGHVWTCWHALGWIGFLEQL